MASWPKKPFVAFRNRVLGIIRKATFGELFQTGLQPRIAQWQTRVRRAFKYQNKQFRRALFTQWHAGITSTNQNIIRWTGRRTKFRRSFVHRAHWTTPVFNTGLQPSKALVKIQMRARRVFKHGNRQFRRAFFTQWHTGLPVPPLHARLPWPSPGIARTGIGGGEN